MGWRPSLLGWRSAFAFGAQLATPFASGGGRQTVERWLRAKLDKLQTSDRSGGTVAWALSPEHETVHSVEGGGLGGKAVKKAWRHQHRMR